VSQRARLLFGFLILLIMIGLLINSDLCTNISYLYNNVSERNLYDRLLDLAREENIDNQKTLTLFFPSKNYLPLKDCSTEVKVLCSFDCAEKYFAFIFGRDRTKGMCVEYTQRYFLTAITYF